MSLTKDEAAELKLAGNAPKLIIKEVDGQIEGVDFNVNPKLLHTSTASRSQRQRRHFKTG